MEKIKNGTQGSGSPDICLRWWGWYREKSNGRFTFNWLLLALNEESVPLEYDFLLLGLAPTLAI